ncbi:MAG TPA: hypothetical protein VJ874_02705 [Candidatus Thermoplasmatota archaeon]|nr:hypothetical protein [Candidatus Thermoplasmatota archaeon]
MSGSTLALSAAGSLLTSALYLYIGHVLRRRSVSQEARLANRMFVLWWQALGSLGLAGVGILLLHMAGGLEVWIYQTFLTIGLLGLFLALWGLQFYLVYLYTGSKRSFLPLGVFYGLLFVATMALMEFIGPPERLVDNGWSLQREPDVDLGPAFGLAFSLLIIGPQLVAAIAYARLFAKTRDRTQRYRIALVTGSIIVWFGSGLVATGAQVSDDLAYQLFSRLIGVAGALVILMAYKPPHWIRAKWGIHSITEDDQARSVLA